MQTSDGIFFIEPMKVNNSDVPSGHRPHLIYQTKDLPKKLLNGDHSTRENILRPLLGEFQIFLFCIQFTVNYHSVFVSHS